LPLPDSEEELLLQLKNLYLGESSGGNTTGSTPNTVERESEMKSRVCGTVLTSYDMSLRDTMMLASSKLGVCSALIEQLGGGKNLVAKEGSLTVAQQQNSTE
jgi:hypothetical protein